MRNGVTAGPLFFFPRLSQNGVLCISANEAMKKALTLVLFCALRATGQDSLSLQQAVRLALGRNQAIVASGAAKKASESRVTAARSGLLPKINYEESWTRSDNPVYVFSSLLGQHQFTADNFQLRPLNQPGFLNNFQLLITADQVVYEAGKTRHALRSAELNRDLITEEGRHTEMEVIAGVVRTYFDALLSADQLQAASQSTQSVTADLTRAESVRDAGMSTDADVLSIRVHLAGVREQEIRANADVEVSRAALNDALGLPLDTPHRLTTSLAPVPNASQQITDQEQKAIAQRPEARQAKLMTGLADTDAADARGNLRPTVTLHGAFEADRQQFVTRGGDNWLVSVNLRWNLFNGFADKATLRKPATRWNEALRRPGAPSRPSACRCGAHPRICRLLPGASRLPAHRSPKRRKVCASPGTATRRE